MTLIVQPAQPPPRLTPEQARKASFLTMVVALVGVLLIVGLASVVLERRRRRRKAARARRHGVRLDPWVVAGQRAEPPDAQDLEDQGEERS